MTDSSAAPLAPPIAAADPQVTDVVLIVHGIRDRGVWQTEVAEVMTTPTIKAIPVKYGRFDVFQFLVPGFAWIASWFRESPLVKVQREIRLAKEQYPNANISIVAHSYGTYIVSRVLREQTDLKIWRIIFCGSVVPQQYRWDQLKERIGDPTTTVKRTYVLNECGSGDIWPAWAEILSLNYGAAGVDGFGTGLVTDRFHTGKHSVFLTKTFVEEYWKPFILTGEIKPGKGEQSADYGYCFSALRVLLSKPILFALLAIGWMLWYFGIYSYYFPPEVRTSNITYEHFDDEFQAKRDTNIKAFVDAYANVQVTWIAYVQKVQDDTNPYIVITPTPADDHKRDVTAYFDPADFEGARTLLPGTKIQIQGQVSPDMGSIGPMLRRSVVLERL